LWRVALRGLFLETSWNNQGKQNLGYAAAMAPVLRRLYPDNPDLRPLLAPFNTNPIMGAMVLGAAIRLEEQERAGTLSPLDKAGLLAGMASVTGAQGDQIFWNTWLPFSALTAFFVTFWAKAPWGPFLLPLLFSALAWPTRLWGVFWGYRLGHLVFKERKSAAALSFRRRFHFFTLFWAGFIAALALSRAFRETSGSAAQDLGLSLGLFLFLALARFGATRHPRLKFPFYLGTLALIYLLFFSLA
jgi:hypothetical protein